ncbi:glycosyltransferase [Vibrio sp. Of7-15]|uniref:glycosyltransferase n=1 Tax=Vibrio sp. Of7-15 TaxID=2724879 RepID=UPI001EF364B5|nr:glycosyltransferase [Vibrio sp. Of7-15]MCG7499726.1 glycosyltransferase [Vibrio sp. Of7-15]
MNEKKATFKVSVVIPTYNCPLLLEESIKSLCNQSIPKEDFEVIISDDGSTCDNQSIIDKYNNKLNLQYTWQEDLGFRAGAARNRGVSLSTGKYIIFIDSGVLLEESALKYHIESHEKSDNKVIIGYVYGYMSEHLEKSWGINPNLSETSPTLPEQQVSKLIDIMRMNLILDVREGRYLRYGDDINSWPVPFDIFWTCHVSMEKSLFEKVKGFDESFNKWGGEDFELGIRLHKSPVYWELNRDCKSIHLSHDHEIENTSKINFRIKETLSEMINRHPIPEVQYYINSDNQGLIDVNGYAIKQSLAIKEET